MTKPSIIIASLLALCIPASANITDGIWARGDGNARVKIQPCGASLCAINVWIRNPGSEKVGDRLVLNVRPAGNGKLAGTAFDPQRKLNFKIEITYSPTKMTTSGCVLGGLVCKTSSWTKAGAVREAGR